MTVIYVCLVVFVGVERLFDRAKVTFFKYEGVDFATLQSRRNLVRGGVGLGIDTEFKSRAERHIRVTEYKRASSGRNRRSDAAWLMKIQ